MFHIHKWSKWKEIGRGPVVERSLRDPISEERQVGMWIRQEKQCEECGFKKISRQETTN